MSKYIEFNFIEQKPKTKIYSVDSKSQGESLGLIKWHPPWRQYCYVTDELVFSAGCLRDMAFFIDAQREKGKGLRESMKNLIRGYILSCKDDFDWPSYPPDINCKGWKMILEALEIQNSLLSENLDIMEEIS